VSVVAYSVLRNARLLNYPFYDAFAQCLPNVDEFFLFVERDSDDDTVQLAHRLAERLDRFRVVEIHVAWDSAEAISASQNEGAAYLRARGHRMALLNQADEFFSPRLRPLLRVAALARRQLGFTVVSTWRGEWIEMHSKLGRFLSTDTLQDADGANNRVKMHFTAPGHVMHLGGLFSPEEKYAHHGTLYGGYEPHRLIAESGGDLAVVQEAFRQMTGIEKFEPNHYPLRPNEAATVAYEKQGHDQYPFDDALERIAPR
jgi:hypothetical protein